MFKCTNTFISNIILDLQVSNSISGCGPVNNGYLGSFDINYFRYYEVICSDEIITENQRDNYNFKMYNHTVKQSCIFKNSSIPYNSNISIRMKETTELKSNFTVPLGSEFSIIPTICD